MKRIITSILVLVVILSSLSFSVNAEEIDGTIIDKNSLDKTASSVFEQVVPTEYEILIPAKIQYEYGGYAYYMKSSKMNLPEDKEVRVSITNLDSDNCLTFTSQYGNHQYRRELIKYPEEARTTYPDNCIAAFQLKKLGSVFCMNFTETIYKPDIKEELTSPYAGVYTSTVNFSIEMVTIDIPTE